MFSQWSPGGGKRPMKKAKVLLNSCITNGEARMRWNWFLGEANIKHDREVSTDFHLEVCAFSMSFFLVFCLILRLGEAEYFGLALACLGLNSLQYALIYVLDLTVWS